jgi:hypothetical protein
VTARIGVVVQHEGPDPGPFSGKGLDSQIMETGIITATAAILGSLVGGTASITTAWITQRFQSKREFARSESQKKEALYTEFIAESSKLLIDSLDHNLDRPEALIQVYALINRIRLNSSDAVVAAAEQAMQRIMQRYALPNLSTDEIRSLATSGKHDADPLKAFSEACRMEIRALAYA